MTDRSGEYRDRELQDRFDAAPVPDHRPGFWTDLRAEMAGSKRADRVAPAAGVTALDQRRRSRVASRLGLLAAAAVVAVAVVGGPLWVDRDAGEPVASDEPASEPSPTTAEATTTSLATTSLATTAPSSTTSSTAPPAEAPVIAPTDWFGPVRSTIIGAGYPVGFSPDGSAVLIVHDAPGAELGCEGAEKLTIYTQDLQTGIRRPALPEGTTVETGGIDLLIDATGDGAGGDPDVATVQWTEYCDGVRSSTWKATAAADGTLTNIGQVDQDGEDDPFARPAPAGDVDPSPTGERGLTVAATGLEVRGLTAAGTVAADDAVVTLDVPAGEELYGGWWTPDGEAVLVRTSGSEPYLWDPDLGEKRTLPASGIGVPIFAPGGGYLAASDAGLAVVLSFGDRPIPVPAPAPCSGEAPLLPIDPVELAAEGVADGVIDLVLAIDSAAAVCDWDRLAELIPDTFTASFGGDDAIRLWRAAERREDGIMATLRLVLRLPVAVTGGEGDPLTYTWPELFLRDCESYTADDLASLAPLGYDRARLEGDCAFAGSYVGYRVGIDDTGTWNVFVAGD